MRLLTSIFLLFLFLNTSCYRYSVDQLYENLLSKRLEQVGYQMDSIINECEQAMIDGKYFSNKSSQQYIDYIRNVNINGDIEAYNFHIDYLMKETLVNLDISFHDKIDSNFKEVTDTSSAPYKAVKILEEVSAHEDISPKIITSSVLKYINTKDFDQPLYRLLFFKFFIGIADTERGLRVLLPDSPNDTIAEELRTSPDLVLEIYVKESDSIFINKEPAEVEGIYEVVKSFLTSTKHHNVVENDLVKKIVSLKNERGTSYQTYTSVYNEIVRAYNEIRDEAALKKYGLHFKNLSKEQQKAIRKAVPMRISEAEPIED